jgi:hypothetical protein
MSLTTKSPRKVTLTALAVGMEAFPLYSHPNSPKVFTQPQLFACLVLKVFYKTDYRGVEAQLHDLPALRQWIGLRERVPDHSTLHKAASRMLRAAHCDKLLEAIVKLMMPRRKRVKLAAMDASGFESHHVSRYFIARRARGQKGLKNQHYQTTTYQRFPKLAVLADCSNHLVLAMRMGRGPSPDHAYLPALLDRVPDPLCIDWILADAGHDSQANHEYARDHHGIRSIIPPLIGRPTSKPPSGKYRRLMQERWEQYKRKYGQRWQSETVFSMIKRNLGCELSARSYWSQSREMALFAIVHDVKIVLLFAEVFNRAEFTG